MSAVLVADRPAKAKKAHIWDRDPLEWYVEPQSATDALLEVERFNGACHDPCCGGGNIVRALIAAGYTASGSDVVDRTDGAGWFKGRSDFLSAGAMWRPNIVMNPPYFGAKGTEQFIRRALSVASGKVAAFVDIRFLAGGARAMGLFAEFPPTRVWIITPRVSCPPGTYLAAGNKAGGGSADYCWLVWDTTAPHSGTVTGWLCRKGAEAIEEAV